MAIRFDGELSTGQLSRMLRYSRQNPAANVLRVHSALFAIAVLLPAIGVPMWILEGWPLMPALAGSALAIALGLALLRAAQRDCREIARSVSVARGTVDGDAVSFEGPHAIKIPCSALRLAVFDPDLLILADAESLRAIPRSSTTGAADWNSLRELVRTRLPPSAVKHEHAVFTLKRVLLALAIALTLAAIAIVVLALETFDRGQGTTSG